METFTDQVIRNLLANSLKTAKIDETGWHDVGSGGGSSEAEFIDWLTITEQAQSVYADVKRIRFHPLDISENECRDVAVLRLYKDSG
ncbi:hypothetical protein [uncultured Nostoc sp.]|uniref:hypothetical protein n=1 Tax=uncultured Nostoc sp. TaxID=340711 RepID=UPI0035CA2CD6